MGAPFTRLQPSQRAQLPEHLQHIADALDRLQYGVIQLTIHDGKLMQLDVTERKRFA